MYVVSEDWARPVVHWEIVARDPERQAAFYRALFHWQVGEGPVNPSTTAMNAPTTGSPSQRAAHA